MRSIVPHRLHKVERLKGDRFERGSGQMCSSRIKCQAEYGASCSGVPMRGSEAHERRHHVNAVIIWNARRHAVGLGGIGNHAKTVSKPLNGCAGNKDRAFKGKGRASLYAISRRGEQSVVRDHPLIASIDEHEAASAIGRFDGSRSKTRLTKYGCL